MNITTSFLFNIVVLQISIECARYMRDALQANLRLGKVSEIRCAT